MSAPDPPVPIDATLDGGALPTLAFADGRFVVRRVLPGGNQKRVYLVHDQTLDRECVLALIDRESLSEDESLRLRREAQSMARLGSHPNLVTIFDFGTDAGRPYFVSEYVSGGDVRQELLRAHGPLSIDRALELGSGVALALAHAHDNRLVHRDVKPANVLVDHAGHPKLADFGLALGGAPTLSAIEDTLQGTAAYLPPERALGDPSDARGDLYSLGATLYEFLTGRPPFIGDDALSVISQAINTSPVAPSWHNATVAPELDALVLHLLAKAPEDRTLTAHQVADRLRALRSTTTEVVPIPGVAAADLQGITWASFVGRERELERMRAALDRAIVGTGGIVMLAGEPGIGKSRLASEFLVYARLRGSGVITARYYDGEASIPYRALVEGIEAHLRGPVLDAVADSIADVAAELVLLLPSLRERFPTVEPGAPLEGDAERARLFDAVLQLLRAIAAHHPLVLFLDDLHWADAPSLSLLQHIGRRVAGAPILIVGAYRDTDLDRTHGLARILAEFRREDAFERLALRGLDEEGVRQIVAALDPSDSGAIDAPRLAHALHEQTEGNPLFIREVLSHLVEEGRIFREGGAWHSSVTDLLEAGIPEGLREVIGLRLGRLSQDCAALLGSIALVPGGVSWPEVSAISGQDDASLADHLDEALAAQLLFERRVGRDDVYEFTHALIRSTLADELSTARRTLAHRHIAESLEGLYASASQPPLAKLAYHFYQAARAGETARAIDYSRRAGDEALTLLAFEDAAVQYTRAIELAQLERDFDDGERCDLLLRLGDAHGRVGENRKRRDAFEQAAALARARGDAAQLARAALGFGYGEDDFVERDEQLLALLREALERVGDDQLLLRAQLLARLAQALLTAGEDAEMERIGGLAVDAARAAGDARTLVLTLNARHGAIFHPDRLSERLTIAREAVETSAGSSDRVAAWYSHDWLLTDLLEAGDRHGIDREIAALGEISTELRQPLWLGLTDVARTNDALLTGRFDEAERLTAENARAADRLDAPALRFYSQWQLFWLRREQGRHAETEDIVRAWAPDPENAGRYFRFAGVHAADRGQMPAARAALDRIAADDFAQVPCDNTWLYTHSLAVEVCVRLKDAGRAKRLGAMLAPYADRNAIGGDVLWLGSVARYVALAAALAGDTNAAVAAFERALAMHTAMRALPWLARTQFEFASLLLDAGDPDRRANDLIASARSIASDLRMDGLTRQIAGQA